MKKFIAMVFIIIVIECIAFSGIFILLALTWNNNVSNAIAYMEAAAEADTSKASCNIKADIKISGRSVTVTEEILLTAVQSKITLYIPSANTSETKIQQIIPDEDVEYFSVRDVLLEVSCKKPVNNITIKYEILLDNKGSTLAYCNNSYFLTNFLATPAVYKNGNAVYPYKKPFGDPYIYEINDYMIIFETDRNLNIYAPGKKNEKVNGEKKVTIFEAFNLRDFPAVIMENADVYVEKHGNINLHFINSRFSSEYVRNTVNFAEKNIGAYPYDDLFIVKAPISQKGMEFSTMIFLSDKCFANKEDLKSVTCHEVLHQWFYGIIGTDQLNEPFMDEGLVNYLSILLSGNKFKTSFTTNFLGRSLADYSSREEYYELVYNDAAAYFYNIHKKLGNNFYKLLNEIYEDKKFKTLYYDEFNNYIKKYIGGSNLENIHK